MLHVILVCKTFVINHLLILLTTAAFIHYLSLVYWHFSKYDTICCTVPNSVQFSCFVFQVFPCSAHVFYLLSLATIFVTPTSGFCISKSMGVGLTLTYG